MLTFSTIEHILLLVLRDGVNNMKEMNYEKVGNKLRKAREYLDLTQEQVASILNLGRDAIIRIEKGIRKVSADELNNFSMLYKISMEEILNDNSYVTTEQAFARGFETLSVKDQKEILDLIRLKNDYKNRNV